MSNADDDRTSPDIGGDEPTRPGNGSPFSSIAASFARAVAAMRTVAEACEGMRGDERRRSLWSLALKLGEVGDLAHDTRRTVLALLREEDNK